MKRLLFFLISISIGFSVYAWSHGDGTFYYSANSTTKLAYVTHSTTNTPTSSNYTTSYRGKMITPGWTTNPLNDVTYKVDGVGESAFKYCKDLNSITLGGTPTTIRKEAFYACTGLTSINFPSSVKSIESKAFYGCKALTTIPTVDLTFIGDGAFQDCTSLTSIVIPYLATSISTNTYSGCTGLTIVTIPNNVKSVGSNAFSGCTRLTSVSIGSSVTYIGSNAFSGCANRMLIQMNNSTPPSVDKTSIPANSIIIVPYGARNAYCSHPVWSSYILIEGFNTFGSEKGTGSFGGSGTGTQNDPYLIFNPIQLYNVRNFTGYSDVYFKLMADIDLSEFIEDNSPTEGWEPIGSKESPFEGHFDGGGHIISGLSINRSANCVGFFSCLNHAEITNLSIKGSTITGNDYVGALAGVTKFSTIKNVHSFNNVNGNEFTGGLIGSAQMKDTIEGCSVYGDVICTNNYTGGLSSMGIETTTNNVTIQAAAIKGSDYVGGCFGRIAASTYSGCNVKANKVSGTNYVGGFIGLSEDNICANNYSIVDEITGNDHTAGFVGKTNQLDKFENCGVVANVTGSTPVGGFVGINDGIINNVFAVGDIVSKSGDTGTGGIAGQTSNNITNSYYSGNITAQNNFVGGIAGAARGTANISKNYSNSAIDGLQYVGGIVGYAMDNSSISSNVAAGEVVNAVNGDVGRVFGYKQGTVVVGAVGTNETNRGLTTMRIVSQGLQITPTDGEQHGTNLGKSLLKYKTTYQGLGWDFTSDWTILDTESFPYKPEQCAPPTIDGKLTSGETSVSGNSVDGGVVYVKSDGKTYSATATSNRWTATVAPLPSGETVKAFATIDGKVQSYITTSLVGYEGSGTEEDPYLVRTASDLANINSYSYYKVMNDIDLTDYIEKSDATNGWKPIGFTGGGTMKQLDGDGHTVSGLWFNRANQNCGLISNIENATVKNLKVKVATGKKCVGGSAAGILVGKSSNCSLENISVEGEIEGTDYVGGVIGNAENTTIANATATEVTVAGANYVGGIAGRVSAAIDHCVVAGASVSASAEKVGGVAGILAGDASYCSFEGAVSGADCIGGVAGESSSDIILSTSDGSVTTTDKVNCRAGGIAGVTSGDILNSYSSAAVGGGVYAGGVAGYTSGRIEYSYSCGDIAATNFGAGIAGYLDGANAAVNHCFAINNRIDVSDQSGVAMRVIGGFKNGAPTPTATNYALKSMVVSVNNVTQTIYDDVLEGKGVQLAALKQQTTYSAQGWDFGETWGIEESNTYPYLQWTVTKPEPQFILGDANGDGDVLINDVILIANYVISGKANNFVFEAADVNGDGQILVNDVVLTANIVLTGGAHAPAMKAPAVVDGSNSLAMNAFSIKAGETQYIDIELNNAEALSALQMDINMPGGLVIKEATVTGRSAGHVAITGQNENVTRLAIFSTDNEAFVGNSGAVLRLKVVANGNVDGDVELSNIYASTLRGELRQLADVNSAANGATGVADINADANQIVTVYNTAGQIVRRNVKRADATKNLPSGFYLIGGKKVIVK